MHVESDRLLGHVDDFWTGQVGLVDHVPPLKGAAERAPKEPRSAPRRVLFIGLAFLVMADLVLAFSSGVAGVMIGVGLWGLHMGFTQGFQTEADIAACGVGRKRSSSRSPTALFGGR